jgi:hypothetical protein
MIHVLIEVKGKHSLVIQFQLRGQRAGTEVSSHGRGKVVVLANLTQNVFAMLKIIRQGSVYLEQRQMRQRCDDFIRRLSLDL